MKSKMDLIIGSCLGRITDFELSNNNPTLARELDELREYISNFEKRKSDNCEKCGCTEFLCGHNQRK